MNNLIYDTVDNPPALAEETIFEVVQRQFGLTVISCTDFPSYIDRNYYLRVHGKTSNPHLGEVSEDGYVMKIINSLDSARSEYMEAIDSFMKHLNDSIDIHVHTVLPNKHGRLTSYETFTQENVGRDFAVRLFSFIPGEVMSSIPYGPDLLYKVGAMTARIDLALKSLKHPFVEARTTTKFCMKMIPYLTVHLPLVTDGADREICREVIEKYEAEVVPVYGQLQPGIIHGDMNHGNILVNRVNGSYVIAGVIDCGMFINSFFVCELAIAIAYATMTATAIDPLDVGGHILAGYLSVIGLNAAERGVVRALTAGRMVQSLLMGRYMYSRHPDNEYILETSIRGWDCLRTFWRCDEAELTTRWEGIIQRHNDGMIKK